MSISLYQYKANHSTPQKISVDFETLPTNATAVYLLSLPEVSPRPLCTGMGKCGRCKIQYINNIPELVPFEQVLLTKDEQKRNIRLACKHKLEDNTEFIIFNDLQKNTTQLDINFLPQGGKNTKNIKAILFVDLGTTSIAFQVQAENTVLADGKLLNPQMFAGVDVMARLYYEHFIEKTKPSRLQSVIISLLKQICEHLKHKQIFIEKIYLAANPSMTALSLGESTKGLLEAPYYLENKGNKTYSFAQIPPLYIPPQLSAFIGSDAVAGLAYILKNFPEKDNFLLADLGTNGEFIYYNKGSIFATSIPLGPALEGVGMRCGSAVHGKGENIILKFSLSPFGLSYTCNGTPQFICGSAYLSLLTILLSTGILNRQGIFQENSSPLCKKITSQLTELNGEKRLYITDNLYLCPEDIENILKVKAAFSSAIELFLQKNPIEYIFLSGALGSYIPLDTLENLGFLPKQSKQKTKILGNSSLNGLVTFYQQPELIDQIINLLTHAIIIDLTNQEEYNSLYIDNMHF